jgi:hypothetical protein
VEESYTKGIYMTSEVSTQEVRVSVSVDERLVRLPKKEFVALVNDFHDRLMGHAVGIEDGPQDKLYL